MGDVLRAPLLEGLGFHHGFNLRTGGASQAPFSSFNLGRSVGDEPARVAENHGRFALAVGYPKDALYETSQVHGCAVCTVAPGDDPLALRAREGDALVGLPGGVAVGVRIADCVPVLLADARSGAVCAIHAGWRGTVRGVVEAAASALLAASGDEPAALFAAIFPHIGPCCFEVGDDVAQSLVSASPDPDVVDRSRHKPHIDLRAIIVAKLALLGVPRAQIEHVPGCTVCEAERFFSYRREGQRSGRHVAAIVSR